MSGNLVLRVVCAPLRWALMALALLLAAGYGAYDGVREEWEAIRDHG